MPTLIHAKVRYWHCKFSYMSLNVSYYKRTDVYLSLWNSEQSIFIKCTLSNRVVKWMTDVIITEQCNFINHTAVNNYILLQISIKRYNWYQPQDHILIISIMAISSSFLFYKRENNRCAITFSTAGFNKHVWRKYVRNNFL
jgi:hypothetical protein